MPLSPKIPKIEIIDDELEADTVSKTNENPAQCLEGNDTDNLIKSNVSFNKNVEHFGSLLGEELVNSYWRRGFEMPKTNANSQIYEQNSLLTGPNSSAVQTHMPSQQQAHALHAFHQHHHQHQAPQQQQIAQHAPSSTALLSQLVNSTFSNSSNSSSSNPMRTDALHHHHHAGSHHHAALQHLAEQHEKSMQESRSSASTPNPASIVDAQLNGSSKSLEDNNNSLCATPTGGIPPPPHHLPPGFLPNLPFQFQDRVHFRFADDLQLPPGASMAGRLGESLIPKGDPMEAKLQEMLRHNMDKYANQSLDTLLISRRVRELLSVHNIGQRLFAKYVLGLSQGTVSELLSKPKPWDKLTEKGRDSYRKMHAWACDDNAVLLLKSLIPKKGKWIFKICIVLLGGK